MLCDFCSSAEPRWVYVIPIGFMPSIEGEGFTVPQLDDGRWNACDGCAPYVDRSDAKALAGRVVHVLAVHRSNPMAMSREGRPELRKMLRSQYTALFAASPAKHPFG